MQRQPGIDFSLYIAARLDPTCLANMANSATFVYDDETANAHMNAKIDYDSLHSDEDLVGTAYEGLSTEDDWVLNGVHFRPPIVFLESTRDIAAGEPILIGYRF